MALIRLVDKDEVPTEVRAVFESGEQKYGKILNTWRAIAHNPAIFRAYLPFLMAVFAPGALDQRIKEISAVRVGILNHCRYTVSHRVNSSRNQGISDKDLIGLLNPAQHNFSPAEQAAMDFTDELTTQVDDVSYVENPQGVKAETLQRLKAHFSDAEISELALSVSLWNALARFHRVMDFELDMPVPPAEIDTAL